MGMVLLTDGLKAFAGEALRTSLIRFTGTPLKAFGSGALVTAAIQSSSATTVIVIGFVSAGLLTFSQTIGVVMGASLGTTTTGWIVSVLGLKINIGLYALPIVGIGAFFRLLAPGRWKSLGLAMAGFGLIFIGIETLQSGMSGLSNHIDLARLPTAGFSAHLIAMSIGIILTIVMQSSSAVVAASLTALHTGAVNFEQAATLLIGAAIGTTVTGALAAIGGSISAKRTAIAHVSFNLATGVIAIILLPFLLWTITFAQENLGLNPGATSLAAFHTTFILIGVLIFLPFTEAFARLIERILPETEVRSTRHLDDTVLSVPAVALEVTRRALSETACDLFRSLNAIASPLTAKTKSHRVRLQQELDQIKSFFARIPSVGGDVPPSPLSVAQVHAIDHLSRLHSHLDPSENMRRRVTHPRLEKALRLQQEILRLGESGLIAQGPEDWLHQMAQKSNELSELMLQERVSILEEAAHGRDKNTTLTLETLDAFRWLERTGYHAWRVCFYLGENPAPIGCPNRLLHE